MNKDNTTADLKSQAREFLTGKYAPFAISMLCLIVAYVLLNNLFALFLSGLTQTFSLQGQTVLKEMIRFILSLCLAVLITNTVPGLCLFCLKLLNHAAPVTSDFFYAYRNNFPKNITVSILLSIPRLLFFEPFQIYFGLFNSTLDQTYLVSSGASLILGLVLSIPVDLIFSVVFFLLLDFPQYSVNELFTASLKLLKKHWQKYLYLELSFLPVLLLCILSLGIGLIWGIPYVAMTYTYLYLELMNPSSPT